jgi:acetylglutamate kinase
VPGPRGGILRWLDIDADSGVQPELLTGEMRGRLDSCAMALRHGVRRVRILPLANVECLSSFYLAPIEYGTEVIAKPSRR